MLSPTAARAGYDWAIDNSDTGYDPVPAGSQIIYTIQVSNAGNAAAPSTLLTLTIPSTTTFVSASGMSCTGSGPVDCTVPPLAINSSVAVQVTIQTSVSGTVVLSANIPALDDEASNNTQSESTTVNAGSDIALTLSGPASAQSGSTVSYIFTVTNNGPDASGNQTLSFPVPAGLVNITPPSGCTLSGSTYACTVSGLAVGASTQLNFTGQISAASGSTLTSVGSITQASGPLDPNSTNNTATLNTTVTAGSDVRIAKTRAPVGTLLVGQAVTFTLSPSYTGDSPNNLTITDTLPANYAIGTVASPQNGWICSVAGQTVTCTKPTGGGAGGNVPLGDVIIPATVVSASASPVINTASISTTSPDPNPANNSADDGGAELQEQTVDLRANKSGPDPALVIVGDAYTYDISATNLGNTAFYGTLVMTDSLPAGLTVNSYTLNGWSCAPVAPVVGPATITCTRTYTVGSPLNPNATTPAVTLNTEATSTGNIANSMTVSSPDANIADTNASNDTATFSVTSTAPADITDISVTKTASPNPVAAGDILTFTITVTNNGPATATNVYIYDGLNGLINNAFGPTGAGLVSVTTPSGTTCTHSPAGNNKRDLECNISILPSGASETITVKVRPGGNGEWRWNGAWAASGDVSDPDYSNNNGGTGYVVESRADVTVTKVGTPDPVEAGQDLTYVITAINLANGLSQAENVSIVDTLPNDVTFVSATPSAGLCPTIPIPGSTTSPGNNQVICNLGTIANGSQQTVTIVVRPNTITRGSTLTNNASVSTTTTETDSTNNSVSVDTAVQNPLLDLLVNKVDSIDPVTIGNDTVYTVTVFNQGPSAAENVQITDTLPATRLSYQSHTVPAGGSCSTVPAIGSTGGTLICHVPRLEAGQTAVLTVTARGEVTGVDTNAVSVTSDETVLGFDTDPTNNSVTENTTVSVDSDLQLEKTTSTPNVVPGGTVTYTISITNTGTTSVSLHKVYDFLPFSGTVVSPTKRFSFVPGSSQYGGGLPVPTVTTSVAPTVPPYASNLNQQQVLWDFGSYALPPGATVTITFDATVGTDMPIASYNNSVRYEYTKGSFTISSNVDNQAPVSVVTPTPSLTFLKTVEIYSDPVNGVNDPFATPPVYAKFIPGAIALYTLTVTNSGTGAVDNDSLVITDPVPNNVALFVNDIDGPGSGPVKFTDGSPSSGLSYTYTSLASTTDDLEFLGGLPTPTWGYVPVPGTDGCDPLVQGIRIKPKGTFVGSSTSPSPSFQLSFRVCVK